MSSNTDNLNLYKYNPETDGEQTFSINAALNGNFDKIDAAIGKLSTLTTTVKTSIVGAINSLASSLLSVFAKRELDNLSAAGEERLHALKGYVEDGVLYDDKELYKNVYAMAHSTFDSTKFTAVGTPTISSSGIASGFSAENYYKSVSVIDCTKPFSFVVNEKKGSANRFNGFGLGRETAVEYPILFVQATSTTKITLGLYVGGTLSTTEYDFAHSNYTDVNYIVSWDGEKYYFQIINAITHEIILNISIDSSTALSRSSESNGVIVYGHNFNSGSSIQSTDLTKTSARQNGLPLFFGVVTGEDVFLTNNYTVVGNPTINNGVMSNITSANYIKIPSSVFSNNIDSMIWDVDVIANNISSGNQAIFGAVQSGTSTAFFDFRLTQTGGQIVFATGAGTSSTTTFTHDTITDGDRINIKIEFTSHSFTVYLNNVNVKEVSSFSYQTPSDINIGVNRTAGDTFKGSIDLNTLHVDINNRIVYTASLKIPFIYSENQNKIVDIAYLNRLKQVYNLFQNAFYFSIDEMNQKAGLPLGSIYKLMRARADGDWQLISDTTNPQISQARVIGSYEKGLSSLLPDDGYIYECLFSYMVERRDNSSNDSSYKVSVGGKIWLQVWDEGDPSLSTNFRRQSGQFTAFIFKDRKLTIDITETDLNTSDLRLLAYRRIGGDY